MTSRIKWIKPSGQFVETNDTEASIDAAMEMGWKPAEIVADLGWKPPSKPSEKPSWKFWKK